MAGLGVVEPGRTTINGAHIPTYPCPAWSHENGLQVVPPQDSFEWSCPLPLFFTGYFKLVRAHHNEQLCAVPEVFLPFRPTVSKCTHPCVWRCATIPRQGRPERAITIFSGGSWSRTTPLFHPAGQEGAQPPGQSPDSPAGYRFRALGGPAGRGGNGPGSRLNRRWGFPHKSAQWPCRGRRRPLNQLAAALNGVNGFFVFSSSIPLEKNGVDDSPPCSLESRRRVWLCCTRPPVRMSSMWSFPSPSPETAARAAARIGTAVEIPSGPVFTHSLLPSLSL